MAYCGPRGIPLSAFLSWDDADQDAAIQWQSYEGQRCPGCGTHPDDWTDGNGWVAEPHRCPGCHRVEAENVKLQHIKEADRRGVRIRLKRWWGGSDG
jgi:hypothetical protein